MPYTLIETPDGQRQFVLDPDAYPDATTIASNADFMVHQEQKKAAVMGRLAAGYAAGFTVPDGPLAGKVLQVRDDTDRTNWLTSKDAYRDGIEAGLGDVAGNAEFRTADNETISCTFNEGFATLQAMAAWGKALMTNSWALKDAIDAAADQAALDAIDVDAGWQ